MKRFWARNGFDLFGLIVVARRGLRSATLNSPLTTETITSYLWTSRKAKLLLRPKNRSPFQRSHARYWLYRNVASGKNSLSPENDSVVAVRGKLRLQSV